MCYVRPPSQFAATPASFRFGAPLPGQHSAEILREAGFDEAEIATMGEQGVIGVASVSMDAAAA